MRSRRVPAFRQRGRRALLVGLALAVGVGVLFSPVEIDSSVQGIGRVMPAKEWVLARTGDGAITATLRDLRTGAITTTYSAEPSRGDAVRFELAPVGARGSVEAGEPVGSFSSGESAIRLGSLLGDIEAAEADLRLSQAGARDEVVQAAEEEIRRAEAEKAQAERTAARQRELFSNGLAPASALEEAEGAVEVAQTAVVAAQARRQAAAIGPRPEAVGVARARVEQLRGEVAQLKDRLAMDVITAPISGRVQRVFSPDTLLLVADTSAYHVLLPVRWEDRGRVRVGQTVVLQTGDAEPPLARIVDVSPAAATLRGQTYLVATAEVSRGSHHLVPRLQVPASVATEPKTPLDFARDLLGW